MSVKDFEATARDGKNGIAIKLQELEADGHH